MSFVFAGTPDFAARVLRGLDELGRRPALVVSQPDRPSGRGRKCCAPEAVTEAERLGIPSVQVENINDPEALAAMETTRANVLVVAAFGQMLRAAVLERFLCLNVHASLLPAYRGAAPIERAIAAGEERAGVSIMRMTPGLDEGPWALQSSVGVGLRDDAGSVERVLALLGAQGIDQVLTGLDDRTVTWTEQQGRASYASKLTAADLVLDPRLSARTLHDRVRALSPEHGMRAKSGAVELKVWRSWPYGSPGTSPVPGDAAGVAGLTGRLLAVGERLFVGCEDGVLELLLVQPAGKGRMRVADFLRGYGTRIGSSVEMSAGGPSAAAAGGASSGA